ncbi:N,N-dimethylformamidase beta subunit family domain-containing protein [Aureliella helgolandensis]|uniref:N,N-dimethylformamidase beta subunit n=1 Tax=Aureliella helgolandensis TaxID=2527968 RepID=A0A518G012_9BACT|nr:N,N-dimethylformamidase beta subunit family domain-containing protein [Aureliella helgolandensis]QDV21933.1 N,N-dimethylformamidase beta subunit [Aureliella helgolandensis]
MPQPAFTTARCTLLLTASLGLTSLLSVFPASNCRAEQLQPTSPFLVGYANQVSYAPGEEVELRLSSSCPQVDLVVERVGAKREEVYRHSAIPCSPQPIPDRASSDGCNWTITHRLTVAQDWKSGYYEVSLHGRQPDQAAAAGSLFFIVRAAPSASQSKILLQLSTNTYNAYTNWGGHSLYGYHDRDGIQGHRVSFDRPIHSQFGKWELPFVQWAEANGYNLDYAANSDLEFHPEILENYQLILSVGHDEYWSAPMRDHLEAYIAGGGNVAFFSGNTCCWQVRSEDQGRALTSWKQSYNMDPLYRTGDHALLSTAWSHHLVDRPENSLTGVGFLWGGYQRSHGQFMDGPGAYTVHRPDHWLLEGTRLERGQSFGGNDTIVGYECDGCEMEWRDGLPFPTHRDGTPEGFTILGTCPARWAPGDSLWYDRFPADRIGASVLGTYTRGGTVVTCGSTDWAHGLAGNDPAVVRITRNALDRLSK